MREWLNNSGMLNWFVFSHVTLGALWFGGATALLLFLSGAARTSDAKHQLAIIRRVHHWNQVLYMPIAGLMVLSGLLLWSRWLGDPNKALWLLLKERFGVLAILILIILTLWLGRRWLTQAQAGPQATVAAIKNYRHLLHAAVITMGILLYAGLIRPT